MSSKLSILEGQLERSFGGVKLLRTDLASGGSCEWIPENDVQLTTLNISKNGTYEAKDYADKKGNIYYGFSQVTVNVKGRTTIVDPDDGNEYSVETDEETGKLKKMVLPSSISVVGLPTKTTYREGDPINKSGMVVKSYLADGTLYNYKHYQFGGIPLSELEIDPTTAIYNGNEYVVDGIPFTSLSYWEDWWVSYGACRCTHELSDPVFFAASPRSTLGAYVITASARPFTDHYTYKSHVSGEGTMSASEYTQEEKTVYFIPHAFTDNVYPIPDTGADYSDITRRVSWETAWSMVYGDVESIGSNVTVKWKRPEDGKELTDTFKITVIPANTSGGETQGSDTGGDGNTTGGGGGSW